MKKPKDQKHIYHTLRIGGEELVFRITKGADGRLYYRPTLEELDRNPNLKPVKRKKLGDILSAIEEAFENENQYHHRPQDPERVQGSLFNDEFRKYIEGVKKNGSNPNRASTYANVEYVVVHYIMPYFEGLLVDQVDDIVCRNMLGSLLRKAYSKSVIDKAYLYTNEFLRYLTAKRIIPYNPMDLVKRPAPDKIESERERAGKKEKGRHYMTDKEIAMLKKVLYCGYDVPMKSRKGNWYIRHQTVEQPEVIDFLLNTGLRSGELLALNSNLNETLLQKAGEKRAKNETKNRTNVRQPLIHKGLN